MEGLTWLGMANPDIQVFEMTTGEGLKQSHEKSVAERFLNLYNLYLKKSFRFAKLGDPPEPDVICGLPFAGGLSPTFFTLGAEGGLVA